MQLVHSEKQHGTLVHGGPALCIQQTHKSIRQSSCSVTGSVCVQLLTRLSDKRAAVEKEFNKIPAAPKAARDIFQLCRGFERAFAQTLEVSCRVISTAIGGLACFMLPGNSLQPYQPFGDIADCGLFSHD